MRVDSRNARAVASLLLEEGAVLVSPEQPFRFTSGVLSPVYCDLRLLMRSPPRRRRVVELLTDQVAWLGQGRSVEVIAGVATAGIHWAAWVAERLDVPMAYVRDAPKAHGRGQQVEGGIARARSAVVLEDLTSTGGSAVKAAQALREGGIHVAGVLSILTYESPGAARNFAQAWLPFSSLCGISTVLSVARETERITGEQERIVRDWLATGPMS